MVPVERWILVPRERSSNHRAEACTVGGSGVRNPLKTRSPAQSGLPGERMMQSTTLVTTPAAKRSALLPLGIVLLAAASYAAGVVTPSIVGSATFKTSDTSTVTQVQSRQGPPDDLVPGAKVPAQGDSMGH
jgi:hypothetical protein